MTNDSAARDIMNYSFLVAFADDDTICEKELGMITRLALRDGVIDDEERIVMREVFDRAHTGNITPDVREEIKRFREKYDI